MTNTLRTLVKVTLAVIAAIVFCSFSIIVSDVDRLNIPALGFSMKNPSGWVKQPKQSFHENLTKYEFEKDEIQTLINDYKNSLPISTVTKHHPMEADGVIPTINVIGRNNPLQDDATFLRSVNMSAHMLKRISYDFVMVQKPEYRNVAGTQAVYFCSEYKLKMTDGTMASCRNQTYAIPNGDFVIQISLIDKPSEQCDEEFKVFLSELQVALME